MSIFRPEPARPPATSAGSTGDLPLDQVEAALLRMAFSRLRLSVLMTIVVCLVFVGLLWPFFPSHLMGAWLIVLMLTAAARYALWWTYSHAGLTTIHERHWQKLFTAAAVLAGASWAFGPVTLMPVAGHNESILLVLALISVCAVAMATLVAQVHALLGFQLAGLMPTALALFASSGDVERMASVVLFAGMLSLMIVGRGSAASTRTLVETELRLSRAVDETNRARERAEAASLAKTRFLANMSHELRTPLNAVIGAAQLMKAGDHQPEQREHLIDAIQRSGTNLFGLIENILDISRIEAGEMKLRMQDFHLLECLEGVMATTALSARAKRL